MIPARVPTIVLLSCLLSCMLVPALLAGSEGLIDELRLDGKHFELHVLTFSPTRSLSLLEQYFRKNAEKHAAAPGALLEVTRDAFRKDLAHLEPEKRIETLDGWIETLTGEKTLSRGNADYAKVLLRLLRVEDDATAASADAPAVLALVEILKKALEAHPKHPWLQLVAACAHDLFARRKIAGKLDGTLVEALGRAALLAAEDAQLHYVLGHVFAMRLDPSADPGEYVKRVATEFEKCLLIEPSNKDLLTAITGIYFDIHERYQSLSLPEPFWFEEMVYKRIINLDPTNARAHNNLAFLYTTYGVNAKEALRSAQIANQLQPNNPYLLDTLGWAHYKNRNLREALAILLKADELQGDLPDVQFHLASVYYDMDDFANAVDRFRKTIRLDPRNAFAKNNLAYLFAEKNTNLDEALVLVDQALALSPKNPAFVDTKGWILHRLGRHAEAVGFLEEAVRLSPETSELHLHLGETYLVLGRSDEAVRQFELAQTYDPKNDRIARDLAYVFAAHALERSLAEYARIGGASRSKANYKIFFDMLAHLHQLRGDGSSAIAVLERFQKLEEGKAPSVRPGGAPPAAAPARESGDDDVDLDLDEGSHEATPSATGAGSPAPEAPAEEARAAQIEHCLSLFPPETNVVLALEAPGVSKIADAILERVQTRLPTGVLKGAVADKLPSRVLTGFQYVEGSRQARYLLVLQLPPSSFPIYEERLSHMKDGQVTVPLGSSSVTLRFGRHQTNDRREIGKIETGGGRIVYFALSRPYVIASGDPEAVSGALARASVAESSGLAKDEMARKLIGVVGADTDAFSLVDVERMKVASAKLPAKVAPLLESLSAVAAAYELTDSNCLLERAVFRARGKAETLETLLEGLCATLSEELNAREVDSHLIRNFEVSGPGELRAELKLIGFQAFVEWIMSKLGGLPLPGLNIESPDEQ